MKATNLYSLFDKSPANQRHLALIMYSVPGPFLIAVFLIDSSKIEMNKVNLAIVLLNAIISLQMIQLQHHLDKKNLKELILRAHTISGAASNVEAEQLRQTAALIESAARTENVSTISDSIVQCNDQLKVFIKEASECLETSKHTGTVK